MLIKLLVCLMVLLPNIVLAQATLNGSCTLAWDANPATDGVTQYKLYLKKDGIQMPPVFVVATATSVSCKAAGVQANGLWAANVHAINEAGESDPSNGVLFNLIMKVRPNPPANLRVN